MASDAFNTGQSNVNSAANQGKSAISAFDPSSYAKTTMSGLNDIIGGQNNTQNDYLSAFKNQIATQPSATDYYNLGMNKFNVQPLQQQANDLGNAMLTTPNTNLNAAKGFNYDAGQVAQKNTQDLERLAPSAQAAQNNATAAQGNAMNFANMGMQQNNMNLLPIQEQGQYLMQQYAAQQTGWTTASQAQLQALQDKMDQGVALSADEMQSYSQLSQSEQSYQAALASANATVNAAKVNNQFQTLSPSQTLVNTANGGYQKFR